MIPQCRLSRVAFGAMFTIVPFSFVLCSLVGLKQTLGSIPFLAQFTFKRDPRVDIVDVLLKVFDSRAYFWAEFTSIRLSFMGRFLVNP